MIVMIIFAIILVLHTIQELQQRLQPSSEKWSHSEELGTSNTGKPPFLEINEGNNITVSYFTQNAMDIVTLDDQFTIEIDIVKLNDLSISDFIKHGNQLLYVSKERLYKAKVTNGQLSEPKLLMDEPILALSSWKSSNDMTYTAVSTEKSITIYEQNANETKEIVRTTDIPLTINNIKLRGNKELLSIVILTQPSEAALQYDLITYDFITHKVNILPISNQEIDSSTAYIYNGLDFIINEENQIEVLTTYRFFKKELFERLDHLIYDLSSNEVTVNHHNVNVPYSGDTITNVNIEGVDKSNNVVATVNLRAKTGREKESDRMVELLLNKGELKSIDYISSPHAYTMSPSMGRASNGTYLAWLEKTGENQYEVKLSGTSEHFKENANRIHKDMVIASIYSVINSFVLSFFTIIITSFWAVPGLIVIPLIEWVKSSIWVEEHITIVLLIGAILTVGTELVYFEPLFYKESIISYIPGWLYFQGSTYIIPVIIAGLAFIPTMIYKKSMEIPSAIGLFIFFVISNVLLLDILFAPYMM